MCVILDGGCVVTTADVFFSAAHILTIWFSPSVQVVLNVTFVLEVVMLSGFKVLY